MTLQPTIVTVPCFSGAPWEVDQLEPLSDYNIVTMRLPEGLENTELYADFIESQVSHLDSYVLVGDSFGAVISLAFATRRPANMKALVLSGGFAENPVTNPLIMWRIKAARLFPGPLYRALTLRFHAASLASPYDDEGQIPWSKAKSRQLFLENTPYKSYVARAKAAFSAQYAKKLHNINVPTLIITPSHDKLIGETAAAQMLNGIPDAAEVVLDRTGHMLRFSHPHTYADAINRFLDKKLIRDQEQIEVAHDNI